MFHPTASIFQQNQGILKMKIYQITHLPVIGVGGRSHPPARSPPPPASPLRPGRRWGWRQRDARKSNLALRFQRKSHFLDQLGGRFCVRHRDNSPTSKSTRRQKRFRLLVDFKVDEFCLWRTQKRPPSLPKIVISSENATPISNSHTSCTDTDSDTYKNLTVSMLLLQSWIPDRPKMDLTLRFQSK